MYFVKQNYDKAAMLCYLAAQRQKQSQPLVFSVFKYLNCEEISIQMKDRHHRPLGTSYSIDTASAHSGLTGLRH